MHHISLFKYEINANLGKDSEIKVYLRYTLIVPKISFVRQFKGVVEPPLNSSKDIICQTDKGEDNPRLNSSYILVILLAVKLFSFKFNLKNFNNFWKFWSLSSFIKLYCKKKHE